MQWVGGKTLGGKFSPREEGPTLLLEADIEVHSLVTKEFSNKMDGKE